jgi:hypothetical protein
MREPSRLKKTKREREMKNKGSRGKGRSKSFSVISHQKRSLSSTSSSLQHCLLMMGITFSLENLIKSPSKRETRATYRALKQKGREKREKVEKRKVMQEMRDVF